MYDTYLKGEVRRNCKEICKKIINYFNKNTENKIYEFEDELLGKIKCELLENKINIEFTSMKSNITIFKEPIRFIKIYTEIEVYDEEKLQKLIEDHKKENYFYCNEKMINPDDIIKNKPKIINISPKKSIEFELFDPLNEKEIINTDLNNVKIDTKKLTPIDLNSLNLMRNNDFEVIIKDRIELFGILDQFLNSNYKILKIYGTDGIGKSITYIYYTHLKKDYKILYFNLKELYNKLNNEQIDIMIYQLMNYFTVEVKDIKNSTKEKIEKIKKIAFENFKDKVEEISVYKSSGYNFWDVLIRLIDKSFFGENTLLILDQYKFDNDQFENLIKFENLLISNSMYNNIKILISSSINDSAVKLDFEMDLYTIFCINTFIENKTNNYLSEIISKDGEKLKYINSRKKKFEKKFIQIVYINELISAKNLDLENKELVEKMSDFNYNPKYFYKFKKYYLDNNNRFNSDELYYYFCKEMYKSISEKIKKYYHNYASNTKDKSGLIINYIKNVQEIIDNEKIYTFNELIEILNQIPLKYIKILKNKESANEIKEENYNNNNIIILNENIINSKFKLVYSFPFIKFVFMRLFYDLEVIDLNHLSPSGIGSELENIIKKAFFTHKNYGDFNYREVYSFENKNKTISKKEEKLLNNIDIFNFKKLCLDDLEKNLFVDKMNCYYICPKNPSNKLIDSIILIPPKIYDSNNLEYWLVSLQITISKPELKTLREYHIATLNAAKLLENIYKIKIIDKYFLFVLLLEYNNRIETEKLLIKENIKFIYFSSKRNMFYFNDNTEINNIRQILLIDSIINDKPLEKEFLGNKIGHFKNLQDCLNRKIIEKNDSITDEEYYKEREKIFPKDKPINFPIGVMNKIKEKIKIILDIKKVIKIKYAFISPFYNIEKLDQEDDLFGLIFYKSKIYIYYRGILYDLNEKNDILGTIGKSPLDNYISENSSKKINDGYEQVYNKEKLYNTLIKYCQNKPSSIYVYYIQLK